MELQVNGLTKQYGRKTALDHMQFTLTNGVYGLLGANGAGKTTLMRLLCGIQTPTSGGVLLDGKSITGLGGEYTKLLGYLPQSFHCYPDFTAKDFLLYMAALKGLSRREAQARVPVLLDAVGLSKESNHKTKTFSGGMKQRLGIAQTMLNEPQILVLDEPTAGLDPKERVRFRNLISAFAKNRIVLLSTHIVSDVDFIAGEIVLMKSGKLLHFGKPEEITAEIEGNVWECSVPAEMAESYTLRFQVSNLRNLDNGTTLLRIISGEKPLPQARNVQPSLEDLYLYYFKGDEEN